MADGLRQRLATMLADERAKTRVVLETTEATLVVHQDSGWRVCDLIGHLAAWDKEALVTLQAHQRGEKYLIPDYTNMDIYNLREYESRRALHLESVVAEWEQTHADLKAAVEALSADRFLEKVQYPWGPDGSVERLIVIMAEHEAEHRKEIAQAKR